MVVYITYNYHHAKPKQIQLLSPRQNAFTNVYYFFLLFGSFQKGDDCKRLRQSKSKKNITTTITDNGCVTGWDLKQFRKKTILAGKKRKKESSNQ